MKKLLLSFGALAATLTPIISVVSCGTTKKDHTEKDKPEAPREQSGENTKTDEEILFDSLKAKEIKKINSNDVLSNEFKLKLISKIDLAKSNEDLDEIENEVFSYLKIKAIENLLDNHDLPSDERKTFFDRISNSQNEKVLNNKIKEAKLWQTANLSSYKDQMIKMITGKENPLNILDDDDDAIDSLVIEIKKSNSISQVNSVYLQAFKNNAKLSLEKYHLLEEEENAWKEQIDNENILLNIKKDIDYFKYLFLENTRTNLFQLLLDRDLQGNYILKNEDITKFINVINKYRNIEDLNLAKESILLEQAREKACAEIDEWVANSPNYSPILTDNEAINFKEEIRGNDIKTVADVDSYIANLESNVFNNSDKYGTYILRILSFYNLKAERARLTGAIGSANSIKDIKNIINEELLKKAKEDAKGRISSNVLVGVDNDLWTNKIVEAKTIKDVSLILDSFLLRISKIEAINIINEKDKLALKEPWINEINLDLNTKQVSWTLANLDKYLAEFDSISNQGMKTIPIR